MRRGVLAVYLLSLMTIAGCLGPETASWGSDGIKVDFSYDETTISTNLGDSFVEYEGIQPVGCEPGDSAYLSTNLSYPISFTGFLAISNFYDSHSPIDGALGLDLAVTTSVAIQSMSFGDAGKIVEGEGPRVDLKNWYKPLDPQTRAGTIDLDEIDADSEDYWYVLGLIPTTSNIHDGMRSLDEWHQPVSIEGYLIDYEIDNNTYITGTYKPGNASNSHSVDPDCNLKIGNYHRQGVYVLVDKIIFEDSVVSDDGNSKDEWAYGDVPFFGRAGFILFFFVVGIGGGVGLFMLSQLFVTQGAKSTMKILLGKEGMEKIKKVASDLRRSKAMGMLSPTERKKQIEREDKEKKKALKGKTKAPESSKDSSLSGFDLDSVLTSSTSSESASEFGGGQSSVVATVESIEMDRETEKKSHDDSEYAYEEEYQPSWQSPQKEQPQDKHSSNVLTNEPVREKREHFSSIASNSLSNTPPPEKKKKTVRKRKSVKRSQPKPEPEEEPKESEFSGDDDFSDFSM